MTKEKLIQKYVSLGDQAEKIDSYEAYKEKIETIQNMNYEELYNIMRDTEDALKVCLRGDSKANQAGIYALTRAIINLGQEYLKQNNYNPLPPEKLYLDHTYEFIEKENAKKVKA